MRQADRAALTFIELAITAALLGILATAAYPVAQVTARRRAELELRRALREMRLAIDRYAEDRSHRVPARPRPELYPRDLDELVRERYLRRVPRDPLTGQARWRLVGTSDPPEAADLSLPTDTAGAMQPPAGPWPAPGSPSPVASATPASAPNGLLFDVRSSSGETALDGTAYKDW